MKKKYRRAVYYIAATPFMLVAVPFSLVSALCELVIDGASSVMDWLEYKLRAHGFDD